MRGPPDSSAWAAWPCYSERMANVLRAEYETIGDDGRRITVTVPAEEVATLPSRLSALLPNVVVYLDDGTTVRPWRMHDGAVHLKTSVDLATGQRVGSI